MDGNLTAERGIWVGDARGRNTTHGKPIKHSVSGTGTNLRSIQCLDYASLRSQFIAASQAISPGPSLLTQTVISAFAAVSVN